MKSSNIDKVDYDPKTKTLTVEFKSGQTYHFDDVPQEAHIALLAAPSIGKHFHAHVKNKFNHRKGT